MTRYSLVTMSQSLFTCHVPIFNLCLFPFCTSLTHYALVPFLQSLAAFSAPLYTFTLMRPLWHLISARTVYISMHSLGTVPVSPLPSSLCPFWTRTITIKYCSISKSRANERVYYLTTSNTIRSQ